MRRYDDPVEVRRSTPDDVSPAEPGTPEQFLWRGRLWKVRAVLAHWVETGAWWQSDDARAVLGTDDAPVSAGAPVLTPVRDLLCERELWRVQAGRGGLGGDGVFDLSFDWNDGSWQLVGCED
ncbi:MAG: hypothetical protein JWN84_4262 [Nocardioides sp.]|nr:hypothetical protein [Nocardioides sp.]